MAEPTARNIRLTAPLRDRIKELAYQERIPQADVIWNALAEYAEKGMDGVELGIEPEGAEVSASYFVRDREVYQQARVRALHDDETVPYIVRRMLAHKTADIVIGA